MNKFEIANEIRRQIGATALMTLGASDFRLYESTETGEIGLVFNARILPFTKSGSRAARPRKMEVKVVLTADDLYRVEVGYLNKFEWVEHYSLDGAFNFHLTNLVVALDYDGPTTLNPRYL